MTVTGGVSYLDDVYRWSAVAELVHELENNQLSVRAAREIQPSGLPIWASQRLGAVVRALIILSRLTMNLSALALGSALK